MEKMKYYNFSPELNFRDLGGLKTNDGRIVRNGHFYRGAGLPYFNEEELEEFEKLNIRTIMDLRSKAEIINRPDPLIPGANIIEHSGLVVKGSEDIDWSPAGMRKIGGEASYQLERIRGYYQTIALDNKAYRIMMNEIINGHLPIYFHCMTGKDRTGVAAMIISMALNVRLDEMKKDYLLSNVYRKKILEQSIRSVADVGIDHPEILTLVTIQDGVLASTFETVIASILNKYDDFDAYLKKEYSLDKEKLTDFRNRYLTEQQ